MTYTPRPLHPRIIDNGRRCYKSILTLDEAIEAVAYWKPYLGLSDWLIEVMIVRQDGIPGRQGLCVSTEEHRHAMVLLLNPDDWKSSTVPQDMERTLVHELLHCQFNRLHVHENHEQVEEQVINIIADAMLAPYRCLT